MSSLGAFIKEVSNNSLIVDDSIDNIFNNDYKGSLIIKDTDVDLIGYIILYIAIHLRFLFRCDETIWTCRLR